MVGHVGTLPLVEECAGGGKEGRQNMRLLG